MMDIQRRIQSEVEKFQNAIHKAIMPLQKSAYLCMAECSDPRKKPQEIDNCYKKCQYSIDSADEHVKFVVESFQRKLVVSFFVFLVFWFFFLCLLFFVLFCFACVKIFRVGIRGQQIINNKY